MPETPGFNRFAARGHHRIAYELVPAWRPGAPAVVLLHSLLAGRAEWAGQRAALLEEHTLLLPEARGHGASAAIAERHYTIAAAAADAMAVIDDADVDVIHVVGHGFGGAVAWEIGRLTPERVRSLMLIEPDLSAVLEEDLDPVAGSARRDERLANQAVADAAYKGSIDRALDLFLSPRRGSDWRARLPKPAQAAYRRHAAALPALLNGLNDHAPSLSFEDGPPPTLIVIGDAARPMVRLIAERMIASSSNIQAETIATTSPTDSPIEEAAGAELASTLARFIATHEPSASLGRDSSKPRSDAVLRRHARYSQGKEGKW